MKLKLLAIGIVTAIASPLLADQPAGSGQSSPPVCNAMPDRQGHFWDQFDWCRWFAEYDNNRERRDREKSRGR